MKFETKYNIGDKMYVVEFNTIKRITIEGIRIFYFESDFSIKYIEYDGDEYLEEELIDNILDAEKCLKRKE